MSGKYRSIKWEITFFIVALLTVVFSILCFFVVDSQKKTLTTEVKHRGLSIARNLSNNVADFMLTGDEMAAARLLSDAMNNTGVLYVKVVSLDGVIRSHNNIEEIGTQYMESENAVEIEGGLFRIIMTKDADGMNVMDFSAPIVAKGKLTLGATHVGLSYKMIEDVLDRAFLNVLIICLIALAAGIIGAFFLGANIARPIHVLAKGAKIIGTGDLNHKIKVRSRNELGSLAVVFNMMTTDLKTAQEMMVKQHTLRRELELAKEIQFSLIPKNIAEIEGFEIAAYYSPAKEVGGDYYDVMPLGFDKYGFVVADVSGKGIPAAMVMTMARSIIHSEADAGLESHATLQKLNQTIFPDLKRNTFITVFYGILDAATGVMDMASAGHNDTYVCHKGELTAYNPNGVPVGSDAGPKFDRIIKNKKVTLESGAVLVAFTDGITEAMDNERNIYGEERLKEAIKASSDKSAPAMAQYIIMDVEKFVKKAGQSDDISLLVIRKT